jgi:hypothetical protein
MGYVRPKPERLAEKLKQIRMALVYLRLKC